MQASLKEFTGRATLTSPMLNISRPMCFKFVYRITHEKVQLVLYVATPVDDNPVRLQTWSYANQSSDGTGWCDGQVSLELKVTQVQLVAEKFGFTTGMEYVALRRTKLIEGPCVDEGGQL